MYKEKRAEAIIKNGLFLDYKGIHINTISRGFGFVLHEVLIIVPTANDVNSKLLRVKKNIEADLTILKWTNVFDRTPEVKFITHAEFKEKNDCPPTFTIYINKVKHNIEAFKITDGAVLKLAGIPKNIWGDYWICDSKGDYFSHRAGEYGFNYKHIELVEDMKINVFFDKAPEKIDEEEEND